MANFDEAIPKTLAREGGARYTETPGDAGGATRYGISKRAYPSLDIRNLTEQQATAIYQRDYWDPLCGNSILSQAIAENLFDTAVNMGVSRAVKLAQVTLGEHPVDGCMSPTTLTAINRCVVETFLTDYTLAKVMRYVGLCNRNRSQDRFLLGWLNRALGAA
ncbi:glycosyl hydrolase 108 family protein [Pseudomonas sp. HR96]|uniref:glycoside hydrolase family 108 protein n=1 Tax=Pseudomonas sp. HR96 TaxID=1027966 RepID=UPI002A758726|nr:glycosyl hydrolase 108 family protein [Pseudomonas sp. HR96]WPP01422.1 glycosyl hydrolase 108 family protein [Pseudomonas sp. HR96]